MFTGVTLVTRGHCDRPHPLPPACSLQCFTGQGFWSFLKTVAAFPVEIVTFSVSRYTQCLGKREENKAREPAPLSTARRPCLCHRPLCLSWSHLPNWQPGHVSWCGPAWRAGPCLLSAPEAHLDRGVPPTRPCLFELGFPLPWQLRHAWQRDGREAGRRKAPSAGAGGRPGQSRRRAEPNEASGGQPATKNKAVSS